MTRHRAALSLAFTAVILGILGDALLRYVPWGINVLLWTAAFIAGAWWVTSRFTGEEGETVRRPSTFATLCALIAAAGIVWRSSPALIALDVVLLALFLAMLAVGARGVRLAGAGLSEIGGALAITGVQSVAGFPQLVATDLTWSQIPRGSMRGAGVFLRGLLIAAPALLIFGALLTSADPDFDRILRSLIVFEIDELLLHILVSCVLAAACAGFLRSLAMSGAMPRFPRPTFLSLGAAETNIALALVNILFAAFVLVQFRYFFAAAPGVILSQYARRGFFELVWVVALVLPMLLAIEWLVNKENPAALRTFRALAATQVALIFVIATSAWRRMQLYRDEFGLTELRVYTTAFMLWLALLLLWFVLTVLRGQRHRFAIGALATAVAFVVLLHAINPDALIVKTNLARAAAGRRPFDAAYAATMSDDAAPVILANARAFGPQLNKFIHRPRTMGWRTWNVSRARAIAAIREYEASLPSS